MKIYSKVNTRKT